MRQELNVDSKALWDIITTQHESKEYWLRQTAKRIGNDFEGKELNILRWTPRKYNLADALTKRNTVLVRRLNELCAHGYVGMSLQAEREVEKKTS